MWRFVMMTFWQAAAATAAEGDAEVPLREAGVPHGCARWAAPGHPNVRRRVRAPEALQPTCKCLWHRRPHAPCAMG